MTAYLLDTDSFIFLLKRDPKIESRAQAVGFADLALSVITVAEVLRGAYFSANPSQSLTMTRALLRQFAQVDLTSAMAERFGEIKADLRRQGQIIADFDLLIGATAIVTGRMLVTNNTKHFQRMQAYDLALENWKV